MKELWINKWKPKNIKEFVGNKNNIKILDRWLDTFDTHNQNSIIITGTYGIGKSLIIKLLLDHYNYNYNIIYPDDIKKHRANNDFLDIYNYNNSINCKVNIKNTIKKKIAIVFDETELISLANERKFILSIYKNNNKHKLFPLIFISNNHHSKLINDLKKHCTEIKFPPPSTFDLIKYVKYICKKEKIKIENNENITKIVEFSQKDIRRLINILQDFSYNYKELNNKNTNEFIENSIKKNVDIGLYDASLQLLNKYEDYNTIYKLYETEKVLLPLMINENYYKKVLKKKNNWNLQLDQLLNISNSISIGDLIETSIYTDQNWYLQNIHGYYTCLNTSYWINKSDEQLKYNDIKFSADLNKTSLKNINKKNINNLHKIINKKNIEELLILCKFSNILIKNNNNEKLIKLLKSYKKKINIKDIELCLKIDKTVDFITLSTKEKKEIESKIDSI